MQQKQQQTKIIVISKQKQLTLTWWVELLLFDWWAPCVHRAQNTQSHGSQNNSCCCKCVLHFGTTSRRCLFTRSSNWLTTNEAGKPFIPPLGSAIDSRQIGHRKLSVIPGWLAIFSRQPLQNVCEHVNCLGLRSKPSYGQRHVEQVRNPSVKSS